MGLPKGFGHVLKAIVRRGWKSARGEQPIFTIANCAAKEAKTPKPTFYTSASNVMNGHIFTQRKLTRKD